MKSIDKLKEPLNKLTKFCLEPAKRGDRIKSSTPAELLGWGARLYASTRCAGFEKGASCLVQNFLKFVGHSNPHRMIFGVRVSAPGGYDVHDPPEHARRP